VNENCEPMICTHPNNDGTCSEEGVVTSSTITSAAGNNTVPTPKTCQECFTSIFTPTQISAINALAGNDQVAIVCGQVAGGEISESLFISFLTQPGTGISLKQANDLVACLKTFGIVFIP